MRPRWRPQRGEIVLVSSAVTRRLGRLTPAGLKELDKRLKLALELS